jgi:hypothetical protein
MLVAFVSLRVFTLELNGDLLRPPENHLRYVTKVSHQAPYLESFTILSTNFGCDHTFRCKRVDANWVICDAFWEYVCVLSKGSIFVHDQFFFSYLYVHVPEQN